MAEISTRPSIVTLINPHVCEPDKAEQLEALLAQAVDDIYSRSPGFISANIHVSADGRRVTNYAQYSDLDAVKRTWANPAIKTFAGRVGELARSADPHLYEVTAVTGPAGHDGLVRIESGAVEAVTLIDVHSCEPDKQNELMNLLQTAAESVYRQVPGFLSVSVHRSFDGVRVTNYAQWRSREAFEALKDSSVLGSHQERVRALLSGFDGLHIYRVTRAVGPATLR